MTRDDPAKATGGLRRVKIVKADFKYPFWRVEESLSPSPAGLVVTARRIDVADHALVQFRPDVPPEAVTALAQRHGLSLRKKSSTPGLYLLAAVAVKLDTLPEMLKALADEPLVRFAEPDGIVSALATLPNDPGFDQLWGLRNTGQAGGTAGADIRAPDAWDWVQGGTDVVVGIIDSGVDYTHADLAANIWSNTAETVNGIDDDGDGFIDDIQGWDFYSNDALPMDENGHGTHVAGTIGAVGSNGVGVAGVNWRCRILPLRFLNAGGSGSTSDAIDALNYAAMLRRRGVNIRLTSNSWGGGGAEQAMEDAIAANRDAGILFVAAAGNYGWNNDTSPFYPASYPESNVIAVAATDHNDGLAGFSHYGASSVDLGAPGVDIYSTLPGGTYGWKSGTSMAAPHVSGVLALLAAASPSADWNILRKALLQGVDPLASLAGRTVTGGRLNAYKALCAVARIEHAANGDTYVTSTPYAVEATIAPASLIDTNSVQLQWNTDGSTSVFATATFAWVSNETWRAFIPAQAQGADVWYWITATTRYGVALHSPTNAPALRHHFRVVPPLALIISATPDTYGAVVPDYGWYLYPSGLVVTASAPPFTPSVSASRWRCQGWTGMGSVPASGTSTTLTFAIARVSALEWKWQRQFALDQTSSVPGILSTCAWWDDGSVASTVAAPLSARLSGTNYTFAGWQLDGARYPAATGVAVRAISGITMTNAHVALAVYLPATQDNDGDGLADAWELFYFGTTTADPADDPDQDGASNLDEFLDRTDPTDTLSVPSPPGIMHTPLADPQAGPAPYLIEATATDNYSVASVTVEWSRNGQPPATSNAVPLGTSGVYRAFIPAPGTNGDVFTYTLRASDPAGHVVTNGPFSFGVSYPLLVVTPASLDFILPPDSMATGVLMLANGGSTTLVATLQLNEGGLADDAEHGPGGWTHSGAGDLWNISSRRSTSPSNAWYCGGSVSGHYASSMHAKLDSRPVFIVPGAKLTFQHWIKSELDARSGHAANCWDGGIVEISTNNGVSFTQITPVGGYPFSISGWEESPWVDGTPCFAGSGAWQSVSFDLTTYASRWVVLRFHFGSDSNTEDEGWYLDDIAVGPALASDAWLTVDTTQVVLDPGCATGIPVCVNSQGMPTGSRGALVRVLNNAPLLPTNDVPVTLKVRSPPELRIVSASQTSTNGEGFVSISDAIWDVDGDMCAIQWQWSTNAGTTWQTNWLVSATAAVGAVQCQPLGSIQVSTVRTFSGTNALTNLVTAVWDSSSPVAYLSLCTDTLVRCRAWDGLYWSNARTSEPFIVDNLPPSAPVSLASDSHVPGVWSTNRTISLSWSAAIDEAGTVVAYRYGVARDIGILALTARTVNVSATALAVPDGTNWQAAVQAIDSHGNIGPAVITGSFWIDTTPPSATAAVVTVTRSPYGNYVVGTSLTATWSGFSDTGSGVDRYYLAFSNGQGTTNGRSVASSGASIDGATPDATNTLFVWARDVAGLMGPAASASVLVLSADGDSDGDTLSNAQEDLAATDARDAQSVLRLQSVMPDATTNSGCVLRWKAASNRVYSLTFRPGIGPLDEEWSVLDDFTNQPGVAGFMTYTDRTASATARFYRVSVQAP